MGETYNDTLLRKLEEARAKLKLARKAIKKMKRETESYGKAQIETMNKALKDLK